MVSMSMLVSASSDIEHIYTLRENNNIMLLINKIKNKHRKIIHAISMHSYICKVITYPSQLKQYWIDIV